MEVETGHKVQTQKFKCCATDDGTHSLCLQLSIMGSLGDKYERPVA